MADDTPTTVKLRNPLNQTVRTLVWDEQGGKFVEQAFHPKEVKEVNSKLSSLTEQQLVNGALKRVA